MSSRSPDPACCTGFPNTCPCTWLQLQCKPLITNALTFHGYNAPKFYRPLIAPFLAHPDIRCQLRDSLLRAQDYSGFTFTAHRKVQQHTFNHKQALGDWARGKAPTCRCDILRRLAPDAQKFREHYPALGSQFSVGFKAVEQSMLTGTMGNMLVPGRREMSERLTRAFLHWAREYELPTDLTGILEIFEYLWQQHISANASRLDVRNFRNVIKDLVWHNEDHYANRAVCYCPFSSAPVEGPVAEILYEQQEVARRRLKLRYPWAFNFHHRSPTAFALPKHKKDFGCGVSWHTSGWKGSCLDVFR